MKTSNEVLVYSSGLHSRSGKKRKVFLDRLVKEWYSSSVLEAKNIFFNPKDYEGTKTLDGYKKYTLEEIHEYAIKNNLIVVHHNKILQFEKE